MSSSRAEKLTDVVAAFDEELSGAGSDQHGPVVGMEEGCVDLALYTS